MDKIEILKKHNVPMIGITSGGPNYIRENIDCMFTVSTHERLFTKIASYSSEESISYILNVLYSAVFAKNYQKNRDYKIQVSRDLEQERNTQIQQLQDPKEE